MIEFEVTGLGIDTRTNQPLVILHNKEANNLILPIWIGHSEAQAIAITMQNLQFTRPTTHNLLLNIIEKLQAKISKVEIHTVHEGTFFASLILNTSQGEIAMDARPSDCIVLALKSSCPIFISESIKQSNCIPALVYKDSTKSSSKTGNKKDEEFLEFLKEVKASDFRLPPNDQLNG